MSRARPTSPSHDPRPATARDCLSPNEQPHTTFSPATATLLDGDNANLATSALRGNRTLASAPSTPHRRRCRPRPEACSRQRGVPSFPARRIPSPVQTHNGRHSAQNTKPGLVGFGVGHVVRHPRAETCAPIPAEPTEQRHHGGPSRLASRGAD